MAVSCLPPPLTLFAPGASSLPDTLNPVALCFFAVFISVLFFYCFYLFGILCRCCSWEIHSNSPLLDCFVCIVNLLCVCSAAYHPLLGIFLCSHRNELPTSPSASVSSLHAIGSLPVAIIRIVFFFPPILLVYFLVFLFFLVVVFLCFFFPFIFLYIFIHVSTCNKAIFNLPGSALVNTLGCRCERFPSFWGLGG
jgi:hypothetical protein